MHIKRQKIAIVMKELKSGERLQTAIQRAGVSSSTWYEWERKRSRLLSLRKKAEEKCEEKRNTIVEDKFFNRFIKGTATTADFVFYMTNRMPERWADKRAIVNNQIVNKVSQTNGNAGGLTGEDREFQDRMLETLQRRFSTK